MMCAWQELLHILPGWLAAEVDRQNRDTLQEIRLRTGNFPELNMGRKSIWINRIAQQEELNHIVNTASRYSPWAASTVGRGYLTAAGGHRIGLCGDAVMKDGVVTGLRLINSLCIRISHDYPGIGSEIAQCKGSVLILGPPGSGKTTLLRDVLRIVSAEETVGVVDERGEIFPGSVSRGRRLDVLTGCPKAVGIDMLLRTMGPECIGLDEITSEEDCEALIRAGWCGVRLIATAHASSSQDLLHRPVYQKLSKCCLFDHIIVLKRDKTWHRERMAV